MLPISRRELLLAAAGSACALRANPLGMPIGSQTYPHRQRIKDGDLAGLCKDMKALDRHHGIVLAGLRRVRQPRRREADQEHHRRCTA